MAPSGCHGGSRVSGGWPQAAARIAACSTLPYAHTVLLCPVHDAMVARFVALRTLNVALTLLASKLMMIGGCLCAIAACIVRLYGSHYRPTRIVLEVSMRVSPFRKSAAVITAIGALMLVVGLGVGFVAGGYTHVAQASGSGGGIDIFPDGSLTACTPTLGCTSHPAETCIPDGSTGAFVCTFQIDSHTGGAIQQDGVAECFFIQPDGSYFTSFNSHIVYAPSGQVMVRCAR